jgi:hypothetical protein
LRDVLVRAVARWVAVAGEIGARSVAADDLGPAELFGFVWTNPHSCDT